MRLSPELSASPLTSVCRERPVPLQGRQISQRVLGKRRPVGGDRSCWLCGWRGCLAARDRGAGAGDAAALGIECRRARQFCALLLFRLVVVSSVFDLFECS